jgi:hypothetical protein
MELNVQLRASDGDPLPDPTRYRHASCWESCLSCCHSSRHLLSCSYSESVCLSSYHCSL